MAQSAGGGGAWTHPLTIVEQLKGSRKEITDSLADRLSEQFDLSNQETKAYFIGLKNSIPEYKLVLGYVGGYKRTNALYDALGRILN
jgi:hypothetical protein